MLAYLSWHRPEPEVEPETYERALERFHRSLAEEPPNGFRGSTTFRASELPWLGSSDALSSRQGGGYEDWYLLEDWTAVGVLEEAAVSRGHSGVHDTIASLSGTATGSVYRLIEGHAQLRDTRVAVWVERPRGDERPSLAVLLGDGMDPDTGGLWRRCLGLGPAPELCLLANEAPAGVAATRLPQGWRAIGSAREVLWTWSAS